MVSLILVGIAPNFWVALAGRALGGALNGNIGTKGMTAYARAAYNINLNSAIYARIVIDLRSCSGRSYWNSTANANYLQLLEAC
jgi:hypothetical protein